MTEVIAWSLLVTAVVIGVAQALSNKHVTPSIYTTAHNLCVSNSGLNYVERSGRYFNVVCNNKAIFSNKEVNNDNTN
jgi:hypothetical protein